MLLLGLAHTVWAKGLRAEAGQIMDIGPLALGCVLCKWRSNSGLYTVLGNPSAKLQPRLGDASDPGPHQSGLKRNCKGKQHRRWGNMAQG